MNLESLIQGCQNKNTKSQEQLYQMYSGKLFAICLKYSRSYAEAQDNLQDGFLLIFEKINQFKNTGSIEGWLKRLMINHVLQQYRKAPFLELVNDVADDNEIEIEDDAIPLDFLLKIIQELPDRYRLVFNLYVIDDYSHKEIADMLGITIGTSKSNLSRAKAILKEKIDVHNLKEVPTAK